MPKTKPASNENRAAAFAAASPAPLLLSDRALDIVACLLLAVSLGALYSRVSNADFQFDDVLTIHNNYSLRQLWPLWGDDLHPGPFRPAEQLPTAGRPLVNLTFALNYAWGKLEPAGYRVVNLSIHFLAAMLLMWITRRTLRSECFGGRFERVAGSLALLTALVWALHPLQTEPVAYVTQRTELLMAVFFLSTLYCSLRFWEATSPASPIVPGPPEKAPPKRSSTFWLALAILACAAGMACKEVMVAAPVVVLLYDWTFVGRSVRRMARESWPLYAGLASTWLLLLYLNVGGPRSGSTGFTEKFSPWTWWSTQAEVFWMYLKLAVWPWPLVIHYEMPYLDTWQAALPWVLPTLVLLVGTLVLLWRQHPVGFVGASVMVVLAPTSIIPILTEIAAERRMYLPLAPLIALAITAGFMLAQHLLQRFAKSPAASDRRPLAVVVACSLVLALVGSLVSARRLNAYADVIALWEDAYRHQPQNFVVNYNLAGCLFRAQRRDEALAVLERTGKKWPENWKAYLLMGETLSEMKRYDDAVATFQKSLELKPDLVGARIGLGTIYSDTGRYDEAIKQFEAAAKTDPNDVRPQFLWGLALSRAGKVPEAIEHYELAIKIDSDQADVHNNYGVALAKLDRTKEARKHFERALQLNPDDADAHSNLAGLQIQNGNFAGAIRHLEEVLRIHPADFATHSTLADAYVRTNQPAKAIAIAEKAAELARAAGQTEAAEQIQEWLRQYQGQPAHSNDQADSTNSPSPALPKRDSASN